MKKIKLLAFTLGEWSWSGVLVRDEYQHGGPALIFEEENGETIATFTSCLAPDWYPPTPNHCAIKDYSENEGCLRQLVERGIVRDTGEVVGINHVEMHIVEILSPELREEALANV